MCGRFDSRRDSGPWSCKVEDWLGVPLPLEGTWSTSLVYSPTDLAPPAAQRVATEPAALFCREDSRGCHLEVFPRPNGELYVAGCGGSRLVSAQELRSGAVSPAAANDPDASRAAAAARSLEALSSVFSGSRAEVRQACMRPCAPDGLPLIGSLPGMANVHVATGHNVWGVTWAPVTGRAISELILDGEASVVNLRPFAPRRFDTMTYRTLLKQRGRRSASGAPIGEQW